MGERIDDGALRELAEKQGGFVLCPQVVAQGVKLGNVAVVLRRAGWTLLHRGAWAMPGKEVDLRLRLLAVQARHPEVVASHSAAAQGHGIELIRPYKLEVAARAKYRVTGGGVVFHTMEPAPEEVTVVAGVRVTTVVRTIGDLLRTLPLHEAVIAADSVLGKDLARRTEIKEGLKAGRGRSNTGGALFALGLATHLSESVAESKARLEMRDAGLFPELQVAVVTSNGGTRRLDFFFREEGLAVEIEGFTWHGSRRAHQADTARFNELSGCAEVRQVLRFTRDDVFYRPRLMIRTIRQALDGLRGQRGRSLL
ncbi:hypothetical protein ACFP1Z_18520 [Streptomyces gamaensis]|uniref:DUF559 domain-containing protein n=1 Tax=Streptomyces gamaensis TaxID=1763542 RepID=A0ABW0Z261_9ACTN